MVPIATDLRMTDRLQKLRGRLAGAVLFLLWASSMVGSVPAAAARKGQAVDNEEVDLNAPQREKLKRISSQLEAMVKVSGEFQRYLDQRLVAVKEKRLVRKSALKVALKARKKK
jgi:hypothetical protein